MRSLQSKSLIFDVYGAYVRDLGGWISIANLITLVRQLGPDEQVVRSSVSRFAGKGLLARRKTNGQVGYQLTERAMAMLAEGDDRIFKRLEPADLDHGWVLVTFSVPEEIRAARHQLRTRLTLLGFGNLSNGLWIAPHRAMTRAIQTVADLGLEAHVDLFKAHHHAFGDERTLVERCWDIPAIAAAYHDFLIDFAPVSKRVLDDVDPATAFVEYTLALHRWRKLPYVDPGLPGELLPDDWEGTPAAALFNQLRARLEPLARQHVLTTVVPQPTA
jgi:phenylacetic acid degradation operon negative regulatory protein